MTTIMSYAFQILQVKKEKTKNVIENKESKGLAYISVHMSCFTLLYAYMSIWMCICIAYIDRHVSI